MYFKNIGDAKSYALSRIKSPSVNKLAETYFTRLSFPDSNFFLSIDQAFFNEYNRTVNAYVLYLLQQDAWTKGTRTPQVRNEVKASLAIVKK